tara:strand:+ start:279 stop:479 length:201 start_codon:yes stop_codon:yes gene_type:complete
MTPEERYNELQGKYYELLNKFAEESRISTLCKLKLEMILDIDFSKLGSIQVMKENLKEFMKAIKHE